MPVLREPCAHWRRSCHDRPPSIGADSMNVMSRRPMTVSPLWLQGSILTFIVGFSVLAFSAIRIYQDYAPIPERIVDEAGNVLFTRQQILEGQELFLTYGLMQFGTVYGHGAYL